MSSRDLVRRAVVAHPDRNPDRLAEATEATRLWLALREPVAG